MSAASLRSTDRAPSKLSCGSRGSERQGEDSGSPCGAMMSREENSTMWRELQFAFKDNGGHSNAVTRVERVENGRV